MKEKRNILFIINPISGTGKQKVIERLINDHLNKELFDCTINYTEKAGHAIDLSAQAAKNNIDIVVAVGGDGSVNEAGQSLVGTSTVLGIIPTGSGNGLARHLNVPMSLKEAILFLNNGSENQMDVGFLNDRVFLGTAGVGFDAHIGRLFDEAPTRGFLTYAKLSLREYFKYKPQTYEIEIDGESYTRKAFLICIGNSNQWGNNVYISPNSVINDGFLRIVILKKMSLLQMPFFVGRLFLKKVSSSKYFEELKGKEIFIKQSSDLAHLDGDPYTLGKDLKIEVRPNALKVLFKK